MNTRAAMRRNGMGWVDTQNFVQGSLDDIDFSAVANSFGTGYDQQVATQTITPVLGLLALLALFVASK